MLSKAFALAKIAELRHSVVADDDVVRLHVAMNDAQAKSDQWAPFWRSIWQGSLADTDQDPVRL